MAFREPKTQRLYLTLVEVAERWQRTVPTIHKMHVKSGRLPVLRAGRGLFVAEDDLHAYEAQLVREKQEEYEALKKLFSKKIK